MSLELVSFISLVALKMAEDLAVSASSIIPRVAGDDEEPEAKLKVKPLIDLDRGVGVGIEVGLNAAAM